MGPLVGESVGDPIIIVKLSRDGRAHLEAARWSSGPSRHWVCLKLRPFALRRHSERALMRFFARRVRQSISVLCSVPRRWFSGVSFITSPSTISGRLGIPPSPRLGSGSSTSTVPKPSPGVPSKY